MAKEISSQEILDAIQAFAGNVDKKFEKIDKRLTKVEALMVTKDYLDDKLSDLRGDLVVLLRKEDTKLSKLTKILADKKVISEQEREKIMAMEPFPKLAL